MSECVVLDFARYAAERRQLADMPGNERDRIEQTRLDREWLNANTNPLLIGADQAE